MHKIQQLKKDYQTKRMVIFVGAGVSKNSGVPTWGDVVRLFAKKLGYSCCVHCPLQAANCHLCCQSEYHFCTDEYIRIPQYYYSSHTEKDYFQIIQEAFCGEYQPNPLNHLIMRLHPDHIITTNFDHLMDYGDYTVIRSDADLLKAASGHYLIKMHGDLNDMESMVIKEDDYLQYSETHPLIELLIKSLLIDHVFVFVGYSLNDYNLKTFLSWIDYLGKTQKVRQEMHPNYLLSVDIPQSEQYLFQYYERKNIQVIDLNHLPTMLDEACQVAPLSDPVGKKVYTVLSYLTK